MSENTIDPSESTGGHLTSGDLTGGDLTSDDLTSPGTIADPEQEKRRAREAAEREAESRTSAETKFDEEREHQAVERSHAAEIVADVPELRSD